MKKLRDIRPILFLSLEVWGIYIFLFSMQDTYHEVNCEGGFTGLGDIASFFFAMLLFHLWRSKLIVLLLFAFYLLTRKIRASQIIKSVCFILGTILICIVCYPILGYYFQLREFCGGFLEAVTRSLHQNHYFISNPLLSAPVAPIMLLTLQRKRMNSILRFKTD